MLTEEGFLVFTKLIKFCTMLPGGCDCKGPKGSLLADGDLVRVTPSLSPDIPASAPAPSAAQGG